MPILKQMYIEMIRRLLEFGNRILNTYNHQKMPFDAFYEEIEIMNEHCKIGIKILENTLKEKG